jgi:MtN3 and saliva related transmembrane protein
LADWSFLGLAAGFLTTLAFLPQVIRTWRTRSTEDISLVTFATFSVGVFLWLLYGLAQGDIAITIANAITLMLALIILVLKLRYG